MFPRRTASLVMFGLAVSWPLVVVAQESRGPRRGRGPTPPFGPPTPEQREEFYNRSIERYMERFSNAYDLTEPQKALVRQRLEQIRAEDRASAEERMKQMEAVREKFRQLREQREAGQQIDPSVWRQYGEEMGTIFRSSPLMNRERVAGEIEKLLPPDQAAKGHEKLQQERAEFDQRRADTMRRFDEWRQRGGDPGEFWRQERGQWQQDGRDGNRGRRGRPDASLPSDNPDAAPSAGPPAVETPGRDASNQDRERGRDDRRRRGDDRRRGDERREDNNPLGSWERYVRDFTRRYRLDAPQQEIANSVLRELLARRKAYEEAHQADMNTARQIEDAAQRRKELDALNAPVVKMYEELRSKLDRIPTTAQRQAVDGDRPATQPASVSTRPANTPPRSSREGRGAPRERSRRSGNADER